MVRCTPAKACACAAWPSPPQSCGGGRGCWGCPSASAPLRGPTRTSGIFWWDSGIRFCSFEGANENVWHILVKFQAIIKATERFSNETTGIFRWDLAYSGEISGIFLWDLIKRFKSWNRYINNETSGIFWWDFVSNLLFLTKSNLFVQYSYSD